MSTESISVNIVKIVAHSYLDPVHLVEFAPDGTINDEDRFRMVEWGLELVVP